MRNTRFRRADSSFEDDVVVGTFEDYDETNSGTKLDEMFDAIGAFGRFQLFKYYAFLCIPLMFNGMHTSSHIFTANPLTFKCSVSECDNTTSGFYEPWFNFSTTQSYEVCTRNIFNPLLQHKYHPAHDKCDKRIVDSKVLEKCVAGVTFRDSKYTAASEFGLLCSDEWNRNLADTLINVGQLIGLPLGGYIGDIYGRRTVLLIAGYVSSLMGIIRSFSTNYTMFVYFGLIEMIFGGMFLPTAFIMTIESVGKEHRVAAGTIIMVLHSLGETFLGVFARVFSNWRTLSRVIYVAAAFQMYTLFFMYESVRWLLSQGRHKECTNILKKAARQNSTILVLREYTELEITNETKILRARGDGYPICSAIATFSGKLIHFSLLWLSLTMGLRVNIVNFGSNKFDNFIYYRFMKIPPIVISCFMQTVLGQKTSLLISILISIFLVCVPAVGTSGRLLLIATAILGEFVVNCCLQILYYFITEKFPTNVRSSLLSIVIVLGRAGSMLFRLYFGTLKSLQFIPEWTYFFFALLSVMISGLTLRNTNNTLPLIMDDVVTYV